VSTHFAHYIQQRYQSVSGAVGFGPFVLVQKTSSSAIAETTLHGGLVMAKSGRLEPGRQTYFGAF